MSRSPALTTALAALAPDLVEFPGGTHLRMDAASAAGSAVELVETIVEIVAAREHLLLVFDDLHWADPATLRVALVLADAPPGRHTTTVLAHRPPASSDDPAGDPALTELAHRRSTTLIDLKPLTDDEVMAQAAAILGRAPDPSVADRIARRSGGIPFFVEELLAIGGEEMPTALRELLLLRLGTLDETASHVVARLSVGTGVVSHETALAVSGLAERDFEDALSRAVESGVLVVRDGGYEFRHALMREAAHGQLLPGAMRRAHRAFAEHLARSAELSFTHLAALSAHHEGAGDVSAAIDATLRAAQHPDADMAPATSATLWRRLADLAPRASDEQRERMPPRAELFRRTAEALWNAGEYVAAADVADLALDAVGHDDPYLRADVLWWAAVCRGWTGDLEAVDTDLLDEASGLLRTRGDALSQSLRARVLSVYPDASERDLRAAVALAERSGVQDAVVTCLVNLAWALLEEGSLEAASETVGRLDGLPCRPTTGQRAAICRADILLAQQRHPEAVTLLVAAAGAARAFGRAQGMGALIGPLLARSRLACGDPGGAAEAIERARRPIRVPEERSATERVVVEAALWADEKPVPAEVREPSGARSSGRRSETRAEGGWLRLDVLEALIALTDEPSAARRDALHTQAQRWAIRLMEAEARGPTVAEVLPLVSWLVELSPATASDPAPELREAVADRIRDCAVHPAFAAMTAFCTAMITGPEDPFASVDLWRRASAADEPGAGIPVQFTHLAQLRLAEGLAAAHRRKEAVVVLDGLRNDASAHGAALLVRWADELAVRAGIGPGPAGIDSLTPRECEVLAQVARGLTNAEVARELFISPKTVAIHVSSILAKTGARNRTEASGLYRAAGESESAGSTSATPSTSSSQASSNARSRHEL